MRTETKSFLAIDVNLSKIDVEIIGYDEEDLIEEIKNNKYTFVLETFGYNFYNNGYPAAFTYDKDLLDIIVNLKNKEAVKNLLKNMNMLR